MTWQIEWDGHVWTDADVSVGHMASFVALNGADEWDALDPFAGPGKLMGIVTVFLARAKGITTDDALVEMSRAPGVKLLSCLSRWEPPDTVDDEPEPAQPRPLPAPTKRTEAPRKRK